MMLRKTQIAAAVGAALLAGATAVQAQSAGVVSRDKDPVVTLYGQVGRALMWADDGHRNRWFHADSENDGTRFGVRASTEVMPGLRAGMRFEYELQSASTDAVSMDAPNPAAGFGERFQEVILQAPWGQLNIGQGEPAADNAVSRDLSGTKSGTAAVDYGGAIVWRNAANAALAGSPTVGTTHNQMDFDSRYDRLMYTTPTFGGFWVQASHGKRTDPGQEVNELGLWYRGKLAGDIEAAIGWNEEKSGTATTPHNEVLGGSVSWLHSSGFNVTLGYSQQDFSVAPSREGTWTYGKLGYKFGTHAVSIGYGQTEDQAATGDEGDVINLGYVWTPVRWFDVFALFQVFTLDRPGVSVEDVTVGAVGVTVWF
jgi:hypothetical protein